MAFLTVGQVAKKTGLTVRALHHYDEIGLLAPLHRSEAGYRLYSSEDLMQLQKVKSLQQLGFSLEEIARLIRENSDSPFTIIEKHIKQLTTQIQQQQVLVQRLKKLADFLKQHQQPSVELLLETLRITTMFEKYYSDEQIGQLAQRREVMGEDAIQKSQREWQDIFGQFRELYQNNQPASCEAAQTLAKRSLELIDMFTGGDPGMRQSLQNVYDNEADNRVLSGMNVDKALFEYASKAMELARKS